MVFLGVGFETTAPTVAGAILTAAGKDLDNFYVLCAHKTMPGAMAALAADPELQVDGFLCPAHVSAIIGANAYQPLVDAYRVPCVVTGFEPLDVLQGVLMLTRQRVAGQARVEIQYRRVVKPQGNPKAKALLNLVFEPCDSRWRGIGDIPGSGLQLRRAVSPLRCRTDSCQLRSRTHRHRGCLCGDILKGSSPARLSALSHHPAPPKTRSVPAWYQAKAPVQPNTSTALKTRAEPQNNNGPSDRVSGVDMKSDVILLGHGSGGKLSHQLLDDLIVPILSGIDQRDQNDAAILAPVNGRLAFTTDYLRG